jgi:hypothetical protein
VTGRIARASILVAALTLLSWPAARARAQEPATAAGSAGKRNRDRWEIGVAVPQGYFNVLGTFDYQRLMRTRDPFEQWLKAELTGSNLGYLTEASGSLYYLFRPIWSYHPDARVRPLLEVGPGAHFVFQVADIDGFDEYATHLQAFLKLHGYLGVELQAAGSFGLMVCGRVTIPDHQPFDYAQAAIFFR